MQGYFREKDANETVIFDAFYRTNPDGNAFSICAGLEQVIDYVKNLHFDDADIEYLRGLGIFDEDFLEYLHNFKFSGNIYAIPEGTVVFPREPLVKVIAPIMEAHQPPEPDRDQNLPYRLRRTRGRNHGVWASPRAGC